MADAHFPAAHIHPQILNYLANIKTRAGQGALVRVGGNSQEGSSLWVGGFEGDTSGSIQKIYTGTAAVCSNPMLWYRADILFSLFRSFALIHAPYNVTPCLCTIDRFTRLLFANERPACFRSQTTTPIVNYNLELFYTMSNITSLVGTEWFFGLSFNETEVTDPTGNVPIAAKYATQILGSSLRGLQVGNEPDL